MDELDLHSQALAGARDILQAAVDQDLPTADSLRDALDSLAQKIQDYAAAANPIKKLIVPSLAQ